MTDWIPLLHCYAFDKEVVGKTVRKLQHNLPQPCQSLSCSRIFCTLSKQKFTIATKEVGLSFLKGILICHEMTYILTRPESSLNTNTGFLLGKLIN